MITFSDRGEGPAVLLIHAGAFADWFPGVVADPALDGFRLVQPVRCGYEPSAPASGRHLTIADHARHCAAVLDGLGIEHVHVVAHSSGSLIGLQLALDRPDLVSSMVLGEPAAAGTLLTADVGDAFRAALAPMVATAAAGDLDVAFDTFMRAACAEDYREVLVAALGADGLSRAERDSGFFFRDEIAACQEWRFGDGDAARITQPVRLIVGGASPPMVHGIVAGLDARLPDAETIVVDGADHLLPLRDPSTYARTAAEFVRRHAGRPRVANR